jgi:hypothetical protein
MNLDKKKKKEERKKEKGTTREKKNADQMLFSTHKGHKSIIKQTLQQSNSYQTGTKIQE